MPRKKDTSTRPDPIDVASVGSQVDRRLNAVETHLTHYGTTMTEKERFYLRYLVEAIGERVEHIRSRLSTVKK